MALGSFNKITFVNGQAPALNADNLNALENTVKELDTRVAGLANVENTADLSKPISTATATALAGKAASSHTHDDRYFTESEVTTLLAGKSATSHNHDGAYFTESEVTTLLAGKAASSHNHDDRYFTESEITTSLAGKASSTHNHDTVYANLGNYNAFHDWSSTKTYALNEPCFYLGVPYKSLVASNLNKTPSSNPTSWQITGGGGGAEPFFLSNSETAINTNGVASKTKTGADGTPIIANTTGTYYEISLPRDLLPNEVIQLQVRSKVNSAWVDAKDAGIDSLFIFSLGDRIAVGSSEYKSGFWLSQPVAGQVRVRVSNVIRGGAGMDGYGIADRTWAQVIAASDGYDAWRIKIAQNAQADNPAKIWASVSNAQATSANVAIGFNTVDSDSYGLWDATNKRFTISKAGSWRILGNISIANTNTIYIYKNGVQWRTGGSGSVGFNCPVCLIGDFAVNDYIDIRAGTNTNTSTLNYFQIEFIG